MKRLQPRATVAVPVSALVLAAGGAASFGVGDAFGFLSDASEDVFVVTWLLGWVLLTWAAIVGGGYAVLLGLRLLSRRPVCRLEAALTGVRTLPPSEAGWRRAPRRPGFLPEPGVTTGNSKLTD